MSNTLERPLSPRHRRSVEDLHELSRSAALSQLYRAAEAAAPRNYPPESKFSPAALWEWIRSYLSYAFNGLRAGLGWYGRTFNESEMARSSEWTG